MYATVSVRRGQKRFAARFTCTLLSSMRCWSGTSNRRYAADLDFLFPSVRLKGTKHLSPDSVVEKSVRPASARIGVVGKESAGTASASSTISGWCHIKVLRS